MSENRLIQFTATPAHSISYVKSVIGKKEKVPPSSVHLFHDDKEVQDSDFVAFYTNSATSSVTLKVSSPFLWVSIFPICPTSDHLYCLIKQLKIDHVRAGESQSKEEEKEPENDGKAREDPPRRSREDEKEPENEQPSPQRLPSSPSKIEYDEDKEEEIIANLYVNEIRKGGEQSSIILSFLHNRAVVRQNKHSLFHYAKLLLFPSGFVVCCLRMSFLVLVC